MITIFNALTIFMGIIQILTFIIVFIEYKLKNKEDAKIVINGDGANFLKVKLGKSLFSTLSENHILLPSACGGKGACGLCVCKVLEGGGDITPTETTFITHEMAKEGLRLSCQVKVCEDMKIQIPEEVFTIRKRECEVVSNNNVGTYIKELVLRLSENEIFEFQPGSYIQVEVPANTVDFSKDIEVSPQYRRDWDDLAIFSLKSQADKPVMKAYSMANYPAEGNIIKLNVRIATPPWDSLNNEFKKVSPGIASSYIFSRKPGDRLTISGPFGEFFIKETDRDMVYIGGGVGMAPMRSHIFHLFYTMKTKRKVSFWYGARSQGEVFYKDEFDAIDNEFDNFSFNVALSEIDSESQWDGYTGFIHQVVCEKYLKNHPAPESIEYYLCGPPVMVDAVEDMLYSLGVDSSMISYDKF